MGVCALAVLAAGCAQPTEPAPAPSSTTSGAGQINPARIDRTRSELPGGYEVARYTTAPAPIVLWGFAEAAVSEPPQCAQLAAPAVDPATTRGWSASGPGGIVHTVVARAHGPQVPGSTLLAECAQWTVASGHTTGTVATRLGPVIDAATTVAMSTTATTLVEGGTQTRSRADTFVAYLDGHVCFVTLITDPGSPHPALGPGFAGDLLAGATSALRG